MTKKNNSVLYTGRGEKMIRYESYCIWSIHFDTSLNKQMSTSLPRLAQITKASLARWCHFPTFYIKMHSERIRHGNIYTCQCRNRAYNFIWLLNLLTNYCNLIFFEQFSRVVHRNLLQIYKKQS